MDVLTPDEEKSVQVQWTVFSNQLKVSGAKSKAYTNQQGNSTNNFANFALLRDSRLFFPTKLISMSQHAGAGGEAGGESVEDEFVEGKHGVPV